MFKETWHNFNANSKSVMDHYCFDVIHRRINPLTTVGASKLNNTIERKTLAELNKTMQLITTHGLKTRFEDTHKMITKEEVKGYNKYLMLLFQAYLTSNNQEFTKATRAERRYCIEGKVKGDYSCLDLLELARLPYNDLIIDKLWTKKEAKEDKEKNHLALSMQLFKYLLKTGNNKKYHGGNWYHQGGGNRAYD